MLPGRREWDVQLIKTLLYPHDVDEVLKIRLSDRAPEDHIAWFYEKSGLFSVRSAYHLAVQLENSTQSSASSSSRADGRRPGFNEIWSASGPPKVKIFAWRLSLAALVTQSNRKKRTPEEHATCQICGMEDETGYHAVVCCTQAVALRHEMRVHWTLPDEQQFKFTGPDWLLHMLSLVDATTRDNTLLLLWMVWHLQNDFMHGQGRATILGSTQFLKSYVTSLNIAGQGQQGGISEKGKEKIHEGATRRTQSLRGGDTNPLMGQERWVAPPYGWAKLNTDAGFCPNTRTTSLGIVVHDNVGKELISSWRTLDHIVSAEEAEALACLQGMRLVTEWVRLQVLVETDCSMLVQALGKCVTNRARWAGIITEIKEMSRLLPECKFSHAKRGTNQQGAHGLAQLAMRR
jgi:ribonuclease HI